MPNCSRCNRDLSAEKPVHLPDAREYCAACCEGMASDSFEMETGEPFIKWIEKHPRLVMRYQPIELSVRKMFFFFPLFAAIGAVAVAVVGCVKYIRAGLPLLYLGAAALLLIAMAGLAAGLATEKIKGYALKMLVAFFSALLPGLSVAGLYFYGRPVGYILLGIVCVLLFGALAARSLLAYLRAQNFQLTLEDGVFNLQHGRRHEAFTIDNVIRSCVVRPGTVGATEGALGLKDGRMLTLDTCLSDLHALGVVMDLRFRKDFPPNPDDLAKVRRDKLRKIRGLSE